MAASKPTKISIESELMKNQKHAEVMAPDKAFEVLRTSQGDSLFFSLGSDDIFYITREMRGSHTGWDKLDISTKLGGKAKLFTVSQNPLSMKIDVALVVSTDSGDTLHLSLGNSADTGSWPSMQWVAFPFDLGTRKVSIADIYFLTTSSPGAASRCCFVDIDKDPDNPHHVLQRYYIQFASQPHWVLHDLPIDLSAGSISSFVGRRASEAIPGIYTFGRIDDTQELIYAPQYDEFNPGVPPRPSRLSLPSGASSIAPTLNHNNESILFVAASEGLWMYSPDNQQDLAVPTLAVPTTSIGGYNVLGSLTDLCASTVSGKTAVWGINNRTDLVYTTCPAGSESDPSAWSLPVPICFKVEKYAFYLNISASNNVLFAHTSGNNLTQLTQDPITTLWNSRKILLPSTDVNDVLEFNTLTTHVKLLDDYNIGVPNESLEITSTSPVSVFIDGTYHLLSQTVPVMVAADQLGTISIVQEVQSLSAVGYSISNSTMGTSLADPVAGPVKRLSKVNSGTDLDVKVRLDSGVVKPLVPDDVSAKAKDSAASCFKNLLHVRSSLHETGPKKIGSSLSAFGMSFSTGIFYEGQDTQKLLAVSGSSISGVGTLSVPIGDFINMVEGWLNDVESFVVEHIEDAWHFTAKIFDKVYTAILDTVDAVAGAVVFVFNQIKIFIEEIIAFLGFLFNWKDILRTHSVIKNVITQYARYGVSQADQLKTQLHDGISSLESVINSWAGITDGDRAPLAKQQPTPPGTDTPQANWATNHLKSSINSSPGRMSLPIASVETVNDDIDTAFALLESNIDMSTDEIAKVAGRILEDVAQQITTIDLGTVFQKIVAIMADVVLGKLDAIISATIEVIKHAAGMALDGLNAAIDIPIISWIYSKITGENLSILDLVCLVGSIPVTLSYKLMTGSAPFPNDQNTDALIHATNFENLNALLFPRRSLELHLKDETTTASQADKIATIFNLVGSFGAMISAVSLALTFSPDKNDDSNGSLTCLALTGSLLYLFPSYPSMSAFKNGKQYEQLNGALTLIDTVKAIMDAGLTSKSKYNKVWQRCSPAIETSLNVAWIVPAGMAYNDSDKKDADKISLASNILFDVGGALTLLLQVSKGEVQKAVFATMEVCIVGCGLTDLAYAVAVDSAV